MVVADIHPGVWVGVLLVADSQIVAGMRFLCGSGVQTGMLVLAETLVHSGSEAGMLIWVLVEV